CVCSRAARGFFQIIRGKKTHQLANHGQTIGIVTRNKMSHAAGSVVSHGAAQLLFGDFLVRHVFDDVGAGDEHVGSFASHENEISDRWGIDGAAGAGAHDGANLRDDSAGKRIAQKNISVTRERSHTFLNALADLVARARRPRQVPRKCGEARPCGRDACVRGSNCAWAETRGPPSEGGSYVAKMRTARCVAIQVVPSSSTAPSSSSAPIAAE